MLFAIVFRPKVHGVEHIPVRGPAIFAANHISWWDPPLMVVISPRAVHFMAKEELFGFPVLGRILPYIRAFPVKRASGDRRAIRRALEILEDDGVIGMFPEGTRNRGSGQQVFSSGAAFLSVRSGAPLVPMGISGRYGPFSRLVIRVGLPIDPKDRGYTKEDRARAMDAVARDLPKRIEALRDA